MNSICLYARLSKTFNGIHVWSKCNYRGLEETPERINRLPSLEPTIGTTQRAKNDQSKDPSDPEGSSRTNTSALFPVVRWLIRQVVLEEVPSWNRQQGVEVHVGTTRWQSKRSEGSAAVSASHARSHLANLHVEEQRRTSVVEQTRDLGGHSRRNGAKHSQETKVGRHRQGEEGWTRWILQHRIGFVSVSGTARWPACTIMLTLVM